MQYALNLPNGGPWSAPQTFAELAYVAEEAGWDGVFLEDYLIWQGQPNVPTVDPWIALAAMAGHTTRIRLGTNVTPLARRRPWVVARQAVTLDHLSHGRFILSVGLGDTGESVGADSSFTHFGEVTDARQRGQMLDEALEIIVGLWSGEPFQYTGTYYHIQEVQFVPRPVQTPRIPIWVGGGWPLKKPTQRAARWDGSRLYKHHASSAMTPDDVQALCSCIQQQRGSLIDYDISVGVGQRLHDPEQERAYRQALAAAGATWCAEYMPPTTGDVATVRARIAQGPIRVD